ncbi:PREDICTED: protein-glutamine gamma-glutamyltransferase 5-like [Cyprinodon variegatus]|uniref:protein-glutamine gamma-glutamyltransferase 5-like n=1 Tax=Cyprinodon variegatus TaxID=28743 RepID=UPI000742C234|nr:PREDICTED: protein-glutamine gamma-glutamyltransferase 5-like [Cyprinodon variegatus]
MDYQQQVKRNTRGKGNLRLRLVNFEHKENHISHETQGLSENHLVVRRGKPFKLTLMFGGGTWNPRTARLLLLVRLGNLAQEIPVFFSEECSDLQRWSAAVHPGESRSQSVTVNICSPVLSSVGVYQLVVQIETMQNKQTYAVGTFILLCNPWHQDDPVYMPVKEQIEEYVKSDYGWVYFGSSANVQSRPWLFGQYESGVLEACLTLLQVSPQHQRDSNKDYILRTDPVYLSLVICAMINSKDDQGILLGKWDNDYSDGVKPTDWTGSADILQQWLSSKFKPVRYGQCWVFASVLCTVMRVLGIPSRVVTVFDAAHDTNANTTIEEYYTTTGEKLGWSRDSIWNFHVWVECWMRRSDLSPGFDGWQVVDPTPQELSRGVYRCGPCPVAAIRERCLLVPYDTPFLYASVDGDVHRVIVDNGHVVGETLDSKAVGRLICTKSVGSSCLSNLTHSYKGLKKVYRHDLRDKMECRTSSQFSSDVHVVSSSPQITECGLTAEPRLTCSAFAADDHRGTSPDLEVSLTIEGSPVFGKNISFCVKVTNRSSQMRTLRENFSTQLKEYNRNPQHSFWTAHKEISIQPYKDLTLYHTLHYSDYESTLAADSVVNAAVVLQDPRTNESILSAQEFSMSCVPIEMEIAGGDCVEMNKEQTAHVTFTNQLDKVLSGAVLSVEGSGLLQQKQETRACLLQPGEKIENKVSIKATSHGTKLLVATLSHSNNSITVSRSYLRISVKAA